MGHKKVWCAHRENNPWKAVSDGVRPTPNELQMGKMRENWKKWKTQTTCKRESPVNKRFLKSGKVDDRDKKGLKRQKKVDSKFVPYHVFSILLPRKKSEMRKNT